MAALDFAKVALGAKLDRASAGTQGVGLGLQRPYSVCKVQASQAIRSATVDPVLAPLAVAPRKLGTHVGELCVRRLGAMAANVGARRSNGANAWRCTSPHTLQVAKRSRLPRAKVCNCWGLVDVGNLGAVPTRPGPGVGARSARRQSRNRPATKR